MESPAITQISQLLSQASSLRETLSNGERLQLMGLTDALSNELQRPDEAVFRITFNQVRSYRYQTGGIGCGTASGSLTYRASRAIIWRFGWRFNGVFLRLWGMWAGRGRRVNSWRRARGRMRDWLVSFYVMFLCCKSLVKDLRDCGMNEADWIYSSFPTTPRSQRYDS